MDSFICSRRSNTKGIQKVIDYIHIGHLFHCPFFCIWAAKVVAWFMANATLTPRKCQKKKAVRHWEIKKNRKINWVKHPRTEKRAGEWCHGNWERLVPCYWAPGKVQSLISSLSAFFSLSKSTWKLFWGIEQVGVDGEADWGQEWAGLGKAAPSFSIQRTEVEDSEVQRPNGPELQPSVSEEPSAGRSGNWRR